MGILIGALLGHFYPKAGAAMKPLGERCRHGRGGEVALGA